MNNKTLYNWLPIGVAVVAFGFYLFLIFKFDWYINSSDFFPTEFSAILQFTRNPQILTGYYSPGYSFLLNIISIFTRNYLFSAKLLCAISGGLVVYFVYNISYTVFKNPLWALLTALLVGINSHILFGSIGENQDILIAALFLWSFYLVLRAPEQKKTWFFVGLIIGISSLLKQYSIVFFLIYIPVTIIERYKKGIKIWVTMMGYLAFGTLLGSLPQLIINTVVHLNPFYNYALQSGQLVTIAQNLNMYSPVLKTQLNIAHSLSNVLITFFQSIRFNAVPLILHWFDTFRFYSMCIKLEYYIGALIILLIANKTHRKFILENVIIVIGFISFISMAAYLEKGTYLPVALTSLLYVPAAGVLANIKPKILFKSFSVILVIYVTLFAPLVEPKTFRAYSHSIVYIDQPRYGTIRNSISEVVYFDMIKDLSQDLNSSLNLNGMKSPLDVLSTPGGIYYDNSNAPYRLKDAFFIFINFSQARQQNDLINLKKIGLNNLTDLRNNILLKNVRFYMPYYFLGPTQYFFDKDFWVLFPDMWFSNMFELEHDMLKYRIKFVILNKKWIESNLPLFPVLADNTSLSKHFNLIFRSQDDYYVYQFKMY